MGDDHPRKFYAYLAPYAMEGIVVCEVCRARYAVDQQARMQEATEEQVARAKVGGYEYDCELCWYRRDPKRCVVCEREDHAYTARNLPSFAVRDDRGWDTWTRADWSKFLGMVEIVVCKGCTEEFGYYPEENVVVEDRVTLKTFGISSTVSLSIVPGGNVWHDKNESTLAEHLRHDEWEQKRRKAREERRQKPVM